MIVKTLRLRCESLQSTNSGNYILITEYIDIEIEYSDIVKRM